MIQVPLWAMLAFLLALTLSIINRLWITYRKKELLGTAKVTFIMTGIDVPQPYLHEIYAGLPDQPFEEVLRAAIAANYSFMVCFDHKFAEHGTVTHIDLKSPFKRVRFTRYKVIDGRVEIDPASPHEVLRKHGVRCPTLSEVRNAET